MRPSLTRLVGFLLVSFVFTVPAQAQSTWTNGSFDTLWATPGNWTPTGVPGSTAIAIFNATASSQFVTLGGTQQIGSIQLSGGYTIAVGTLQINSAAGITISSDDHSIGDTPVTTSIILGANQTWNIAANISLTIEGIVAETGGSKSISKSGSGTLLLNASNTFTGGMTLTGGTTILNPLNANGLVSGTIALSNSGTSLNLGQAGGGQNALGTGTTGANLSIGAGTTVTADTVSQNLYSVGINGGTLARASTGSFVLNNTITSTGASSIMAPVNLNAANRNLNIISGTLTVSAPMTNGGISQTGAGTLQLGAAFVLPTAGAYSLGGGTLATGGFSNTTGTLSLPTGSATIALGNSNHNLTFGAFDPTGFSGSSTLTITGWTGNAGQSGTNGHIFFTNPSGFTPSMLATQVIFSGFGPGARFLATNELVPVPEPVTVLGLSGLGLGFVGLFRQARRVTSKG